MPSPGQQQELWTRVNNFQCTFQTLYNNLQIFYNSDFLVTKGCQQLEL